MIISKIQSFDFLSSALTDKNEFQTMKSFLTWFKDKGKISSFKVQEIPFEELDQWYFEKETKNLRHNSGKFFTIEGISVVTNFGTLHKWEQPIIFQPEIGILGIITKVFDGLRYFLMQAKMEPGNVNIIQLSPTVQATKSNFTKVHKGNLPAYLEYFVDKAKSKILIDQLQPEQGGRFFKKRNRNMVVEVIDDIKLKDDFIWLTLAQIKELFRIDNFVNMDARSVLATIPFISEENIHPELNKREFDFLLHDKKISSIGSEIIVSSISFQNSFKQFDEIISWITEMKTKYEIHVTRIPLAHVSQWNFSDNSINHESNRFFSIVGVKVQAGTREVVQWTQPLLKETNFGLIGFLVKRIEGILHFLVQAKVEPGNIDVIELAPTVSCSDYAAVIKTSQKPPFIEYFISKNTNNILYSGIQSEEGGRFLNFQNKNMIVVTDDNFVIPDNYFWITLAQMMRLMKFGYMNIESRSILSALQLL